MDVFDGALNTCIDIANTNCTTDLTTFSVLKKNEERRYGEYRAARLALAAYDALAPALVGAAVR